MDTCKTCRFYHSNRFESECRRNPPTVNQVGNSVWPRVRDGNWCGAHERLPTPPPEARDE